MKIGSAVVDGTGAVHGTWTGAAGKEGQIGGMIFSVLRPQDGTVEANWVR